MYQKREEHKLSWLGTRWDRYTLVTEQNSNHSWNTGLQAHALFRKAEVKVKVMAENCALMIRNTAKKDVQKGCHAKTRIYSG